MSFSWYIAIRIHSFSLKVSSTKLTIWHQTNSFPTRAIKTVWTCDSQSTTWLFEGTSTSRPLSIWFRLHHSTQTALLGLTEEVRQAIDQRMVIVLTLFNDLPAVLQPSKHKNLCWWHARVWAQLNCIKLNPDKTKLIIFGSERYIANLNLSALPPLVIDNVAVNYSTCVSDLGCKLTSTLNWKKQVNQICSRIHGSMTRYLLRFHRYALSLELRRRLTETRHALFCLRMCGVQRPYSRTKSNTSPAFKSMYTLRK